MSTRIKVYTASKLHEAPRWKSLIEEWPEVEFVARWVNCITYDEASGDEDVIPRIVEGWIDNVEDVKRCDVVLVYSQGETLRGALVEAGMGIAFGKTVIVVGTNESHGTWQYHPQVIRLPTLEVVRALLKKTAEDMP